MDDAAQPHSTQRPQVLSVELHAYELEPMLFRIVIMHKEAAIVRDTIAGKTILDAIETALRTHKTTLLKE